MMIHPAYHGFLKSHLMWHGRLYGLTQFSLDLRDIDRELLVDIPSGLRLGHQAEYVFLNLLRASPYYRVITHSLQIISNKKTLGEIDFIIEDKRSSQIIHLEFTYKFYLLDLTITNPIDQYVGPNRKDTFVAKISKLRDKQIPLIYGDEGRKLLYNYEVDIEKLVQRVAFYGHIFIPYQSRGVCIDPLNEDCIVGYWVDKSDFTNSEFRDDRYYIPSKSEWLHVPHNNTDWISYAQVQSYFLQTNKAVLVWRKSVDVESISRLFYTQE